MLSIFVGTVLDIVLGTVLDIVLGIAKLIQIKYLVINKILNRFNRY